MGQYDEVGCRCGYDSGRGLLVIPFEVIFNGFNIIIQ